MPVIILSIAVSIIYVSTIFLSHLVFIKIFPLGFVYLILAAVLYGLGMISRNNKSWILKWLLSVLFSYIVLRYFWQTDFSIRALNWVLPGYGKESAGGGFAGLVEVCYRLILCFVSGIASIFLGKVIAERGKYEKFGKIQLIITATIALILVVITMALESRFPSVEDVNALIYS